MRRSLDVVFILVVCALSGLLYYNSRPSSSPKVSFTPGPDSVDFTLQDVVSGEERSLADQPGPVLVTLTSLGCQPCQARVGSVDREAARLASERGVPVWNIIVYAERTAAATWVAEHSPAAELVLADPGARVGVQQLGGSDVQCYILLDGQHRKAWQGPADVGQLESAMDSIQAFGPGEVTGATTVGTPPPVTPPPGMGQPAEAP